VRGKHYCDGQLVHANYIYPITGRIGVDKLVKSFIELTLFANLAGKGPSGAGLPTMADELTFTTSVNASATPKVVFTPVGQAFQLSDASLTGVVKRGDVHQVTMALAIATGDQLNLDPLRSFLFSSERSAGQRSAQVAGAAAASDPPRRRAVSTSLVVGRRVTGGGTPSEVLAVLAIDQLKSREFELVRTP